MASTRRLQRGIPESQTTAARFEARLLVSGSFTSRAAVISAGNNPAEHGRMVGTDGSSVSQIRSSMWEC